MKPSSLIWAVIFGGIALYTIQQMPAIIGQADQLSGQLVRDAQINGPIKAFNFRVFQLR